jgi:carboxylesterase
MAAPIGCLILHGFTSSLDTVQALVPVCEQLGLPYRTPLLRGHGTQPEDLRGVTWQDWYADAEAALDELRTHVEHVVVCGLSMGGLIALHLAAARPHDVAGVVTIAAALEIANPWVRATPLMARFISMRNSHPANGYADPSLVTQNTNYRRYPLDALVSLYRYGPVVKRLLPQVRAPLLVIHSHNDRTITPRSAEMIYEQAGSSDKQLRWFDNCRHQMLQDCEADAIVATIADILKRIADQRKLQLFERDAHQANRRQTQ